MMKFFRGTTKYVGVVFAVLMFIFVLTSVDFSQLSGAANTVGKIDGERVDARIYEAAVQNAVDNAQRTNPGRLGLDEIQQIRDEVWEQFIQNSVLEKEYKRRGITVSDAEVVDAMRSSPPPELLRSAEFQTDSQFDLAKYQRWLTSPAAQPILEPLAASYRDQIRRLKLYRELAGDVYASDAALWQAWRDERETVTIGLAAISPQTVVADDAVPVTEQEARDYYDAHRKEFARPAAAFLSYISVSRQPIASDSAAALARANAVRAEILGGAPFAEVAQRESADTVSAAKGGDLGEWARGSFDPAFERAAFSLPLNAVSEPVLSRFGYHVLQVYERKGDKARARHVLVPIEVTGDHRAELDARADSLDRLAAEQLDPAALDTVARALGLTIQSLGPVYQGFKAQVGATVIPDAATWAFEHRPGEISNVIETADAMYLVRLDSLQEAGTPTFAQVREAAVQGARDAKKLVKAREAAQALLDRVRAGATLAQAAQQVPGAQYRVFGPFTRLNAPVSNARVVGAAFGTPVGRHSGVLEAEDAVYVLEVIGRVAADSAAFARERQQYRAQREQLLRQQRVQNTLAALREGAKVDDRRAELMRAARAAQPTS